MNEAERIEGRRLWAAIMLALDLDTCRSILLGKPVRAGCLDGVVLRRGLRGGTLPHPEDYLLIDREILDAVAEAGAVGG